MCVNFNDFLTDGQLHWIGLDYDWDKITVINGLDNSLICRSHCDLDRSTHKS